MVVGRRGTATVSPASLSAARSCRSISPAAWSNSSSTATASRAPFVCYERAGMRAFRAQIVYEKELRAGTDITTRA
jgi:hypothetical protein